MSTEIPDLPQEPEGKPETQVKRPWPMSYIIIAILLFVLLFNLWIGLR